MKNIKVITRHAVSNYGSLLQSIATVKVFNTLGFDCKIIDYQNKSEDVLKSLNDFANLRNYKGLRKLLYVLLKYPSEKKKYFTFEKMRKKYLPLTKRYTQVEEIKNQFDNDILCSGGDQLWGLMPNNNLDETYYLTFGNDTNFKISLSSSFGRYDFNIEQTNLISNELKKYSFVSVRESSAIDFLNTFFISSKLILDPTLLVEDDLWHSLSNGYKYKSDYVLVYKLRQDDKLNQLANRIAKEKNLKVIYVTNTVFNKNKGGENFVNKELATVISLFENASYIVTDSFHASVFSVIFKKKFSTHLPGKTNARIEDFLKMLGISYRIFDDVDSFDYERFINYEKITEILKNMRKDDISYLKDKLNELKK